MNFSHIEELPWSEVKETITKIDPVLTGIIEEWNPGNDYTLLRVVYPYGALILNEGTFQIPTQDGFLVPLDHPSVPQSLQKKLNYQSLPLGFLVRGSAEVFRDFTDRVFSLGFFGKGFEIGIFETFGSSAPYCFSAGARSIFMIPRISDKDAHKKLKAAYGIRLSVPKTLFDQWHLFVELAKRFEKPWHCEILFLTSKWTKECPKKIGWHKFKNYLLTKAWKHTEYARNRTVFEVSWKNFCTILMKKGLRPDPYLIETLRHLIFIAQGTLPAFISADNSQLAAPTQQIQDAYVKKYGLKNYAPILMVPHHFSLTGKTPVYYSLQTPTLLDFFPKNKAFASAIDDLRELKDLMSYFMEVILQGQLKFENRLFHEILSNIKFDYFHSEMYSYGDIQPSNKIIENDPTLINIFNNQNCAAFAHKGSFVRCCVRISKR